MAFLAYDMMIYDTCMCTYIRSWIITYRYYFVSILYFKYDIAALVRISSTSERKKQKTYVKDRWFIRNHSCIVFTRRKPMELKSEYGWPQGQLRVKSCGVARYILKGVVFAALGQKTGRVAGAWYAWIEFKGTVFLSTFGPGGMEVDSQFESDFNSDPSGMDSLLVLFCSMAWVGVWSFLFGRGIIRSHRNCGETPRSYRTCNLLQVQEITWKWLNSYFSWWGLGGLNLRSQRSWQGVVDTTWKGWRMRFNWQSQ